MTNDTAWPEGNTSKAGKGKSMAIPEDTKARAIYHTILSDLHRVQSILLNLQTLEADGTTEGLRDHFTRDQTLVIGRLNEWRGRRPDIYREANDDFQHQVRRPEQSQ